MHVFINQIRQKIGVMYGDPNTTTGGLALKFYASVRMEVKRVTHVKDGDETIGAETRVRVVKNKIAPPFRNAEFEILHDRGIDFEGDVMKLALEDEVVQKSGAFFSYKDQRLGPTYQLPIAIILNDRGGSAPEVLAAGLKENKRATIVGARSAGCLGSTSSTPLGSDGSEVYVVNVETDRITNSLNTLTGEIAHWLANSSR